MTACNVILQDPSGVYTLRNYGRRVNCTASIMFPESFRVLSTNIGSTGIETASARNSVETGLIRQVTSRTLFHSIYFNLLAVSWFLVPRDWAFWLRRIERRRRTGSVCYVLCWWLLRHWLDSRYAYCDEAQSNFRYNFCYSGTQSGHFVRQYRSPPRLQWIILQLNYLFLWSFHKPQISWIDLSLLSGESVSQRSACVLLAPSRAFISQTSRQH